MAKQRADLSALEQKVMHVVWETSPITADQVRAKLSRSNPMKDSTARTILRRLEEKGYVTHSVDGRTFLYRPKIEKPNVASEAVMGIVDKFCAGSIENLLMGMVDSQVLTPDKLQALADKISKAKAESAKKDGARTGKKAESKSKRNSKRSKKS